MTGFEIEKNELADDINPSTRCACILALDVSSSMFGPPIDELNEGVKLFYQEIENDKKARHAVEIGIVTFSTGARVVTQISTIDGPAPPTLQAYGTTSLGEGLNLALDILEKRKGQYKQMGVSYFQPWAILMTDGMPTDEYRIAAQRVHELSGRGKLVFLGIAIGEEADMDTLKQICPQEYPPVRLKGIEFRKFFKWLSQSMSAVSISILGNSVNLPSTNTWADIPNIQT